MKDMSEVTPASDEMRRYAAFVSYSHADEDLCAWLHKRIETYRVPDALVGRITPAGPIKRRIGKIFRDRAELSAAHDLGAEIRDALERSDALILLCSPNACRSGYVAEEIRTFKRLGRGHRIFAAIADGEPHAAGKPGRTPDEECFPAALIYKIDADGNMTGEPEATEPFAADFRDGKDGRENGSLKLIAGLLDVGLDELVQRERQAERRRRIRSNLIAGAMTVLALFAGVAGLSAWSQAQSARNAIVRVFAEADGETDPLLSARYMLAAMREAPVNADLYRGRLGAVLFDWNDARLLREGDFADADWSSDGSRLLTTTADGVAQLWDARTLELIATLEPGVVPRSAGFSADGSRIVAGSTGGARVWNAADGQFIFSLPHRYLVQQAAFAGGDARIATFDRETVTIWDAESRRQILRIDEVDGARVSYMAISADGEHLVLASATRLELHRPGIGDPVMVRPVGEMTLAAINGIGFSPDGNYFYAFAGRALQVWRTADASLAQTRVLDGSVSDVSFHNDGRRFYATSTGVLSQWFMDDEDSAFTQPARILADTTENPRLFMSSRSDVAVITRAGASVFSNHSDAVASLRDFGGETQAIAFSPDGDHMLLVSNRSARVQRTSGRMAYRIWQSPLDVSSDGAHMLTISDRGLAVSVANTESGELWRHEIDAADAAFADDVVVAAVGDALHIYDRQSGTLRATRSESQYTFDRVGRIYSLNISGHLVVTNGVEGAGVWSLEDTHGPFSVQPGIGGAVFSQDGGYIAALDTDRQLSIWNRTLQRKIAELDEERSVRDYAFSPVGDFIAIAYADGSVGLWDFEADTQIILPSEQDPLTAIAFSPDETRLFTGGQSGVVTVWNVTTRRVIKRFETGAGPIRDISLNGAGTQLLVSGSTGTSVWDVARLTQSMQELVRAACMEFLLPRDRRFSRAELDADPLIGVAFTYNGRDDRDVCEGVRGRASAGAD